MEEAIRVIVIDDHLVSRAGIIGLLRQNPKIVVVAEGWAGNHVWELVDKHKPDVLLTDLLMPAHAEGRPNELFEPIRTLYKVIQTYPQTAIIVISQEHDISTIQSLAEIGVKGYFLKTDDFTQSLGIAVEHIRQGMLYFSPEVAEIIRFAPKISCEIHLTKQQKRVLQAVFRSPEASRVELASSLGIAPSTLKKHINALYYKFGTPTMVACILKAMRMGLIEMDAESEI
jgi:DNA-binding NarL/FixJ family response regulator